MHGRIMATAHNGTPVWPPLPMPRLPITNGVPPARCIRPIRWLCINAGGHRLNCLGRPRIMAGGPPACCVRPVSLI